MGLSGTPKKLSSKYFYDEKGDSLFQQIMHMGEYYLTDSEYEILDIHKQSMLEVFREGDVTFDLVEFGAGDGLKTKVLLRHFLAQQAAFQYAPVDISANVLKGLEAKLSEEMPGLSIRTLNHEYFSALKKLKEMDSHRKVILFMGGNIGNFQKEEAIAFLSELRSELNAGDLLLIGFDLKKDPRVIRQAYDDPAGITGAFNMNLLDRINRELGADFDLSSYRHYETYHPLTGKAESFLISNKKQVVNIPGADSPFLMTQWEPIHVEISQKYDMEMIQDIRERSGFDHVEDYYDCKHWLVDALWRVG